MSYHFVGELYDIPELSLGKKIKILAISKKEQIIELDNNIQKQLIKGASKKENAYKIKSCKPYTFYKKYDRLIITISVSNQSSGLFYLDNKNIGRPFNIHCTTRKYSFVDKKSGDIIVGWNMLLKKINPLILKD